MRRILASIILSLTILACTPSAAANATPAPTATTTPTATCDRACWEAVIQRQRDERTWWAEVVRQQQARAAWARLTAHLAATRTSSYRPGQCGGSLPPCYVMRRESGGNIRAQNPRSTASGKWQFLDSTWHGYGGYAKARHAPESVQDAKARLLWAGGRGCSHWSAC